MRRHHRRFIDAEHLALDRLGFLLRRTHEFVAVQRQGAGLARVAHHHRTQEYHEVGLAARARFAAEQTAEDRHVAQARHFLLVARVFILQQAAEHHDGAVVDQHGRLDGALVGDQPGAGVDGGRLHVADLLEDGHLDGAVLTDLRLHAQRDAHVLALDGLERIDRAFVAAGVGELAGDERHVLADHDLGFLVVQREQVGGGEDVALTVLLQETCEEAQHVDAVGAARQAEVQARVGRCFTLGQVDDVVATGAEVGAEQANHAVARTA